VSVSSFDPLGRTTQTIQDSGTGLLNSTTDYTYGPAGMTSMTSVQTGGAPNQTTVWIYGVSTSSGSAINSDDIVGQTNYPNPTTGSGSGDGSSGEVTTTVDAQGQTLTMTDRNGTTHAYAYDSLGRQISDTVTALGSGSGWAVDGSVMKIAYTYDAQGNQYLTTSFNSSGGIVNQVMRLFNGFGQLTQEFQSASGDVEAILLQVRRRCPDATPAPLDRAQQPEPARHVEVPMPDLSKFNQFLSHGEPDHEGSE
jgi:YD repeat-containing protein